MSEDTFFKSHNFPSIKKVCVPKSRGVLFSPEPPKKQFAEEGQQGDVYSTSRGFCCVLELGEIQSRIRPGEETRSLMCKNVAKHIFCGQKCLQKGNALAAS